MYFCTQNGIQSVNIETETSSNYEGFLDVQSPTQSRASLKILIACPKP